MDAMSNVKIKLTDKYKCPLCGAPIGEVDNFFHCTKYRYKDGHCPYKIWKTLFNIKLSDKNLDELLTKGKTEDVVYGFVNRKTNEVVGHKLYYNKDMCQVRFLYETKPVTKK